MITQYKVNSTNNITDPKVVFDPKFKKTEVAKAWKPQNDESPVNENVDYTKIDGYKVPIIKINTQVIANDDIVMMRINYCGFKPTVELILKAANYLDLEIPGMPNRMTIVMLPPVDGTYKKISLDFYITSIKDMGHNKRYTGEMILLPLEKTYTRFIKSDGEKFLNTYQLISTIAKESELGFACTENCANVNDSRIRLVRGQNMQEVIKEHIQFAGVDDNSIFDCWLDVYGYIVLVNVSWVLNRSTKIDELAMKKLVGMNIYDAQASEQNAIEYEGDTFRTFTNCKINAEKTHNYISNYNWDINNAMIKINGTENSYYTLGSKTSGSSNSIDILNTNITENSIDGTNYKSSYLFQKAKFLGTEMANVDDGNYPTIFQQKRRDNYMSKINAKKMVVKLKDFNIGLERGMLINISIWQYDRENKSMIISNIENLKENGDTSVISNINFTDVETLLNDTSIGIPDFAASGIYYIDGIEYIYDTKEGKIYQILHLIRQSRFANYLNMSSLPKIN